MVETSRVRRFYSDVTVTADEEGFGVALDGRPVRTPKRAPLMLPNAQLAEVIADEWRTQGEEIFAEALRLTGLANAAIDLVAPDPVRFAQGLACFAACDLLCYRADHPADLAARQAAEWDPPLRGLEARLDVRFALSNGVQFVAQPDATLNRIANAYSALSAWELAPLQPIVTITGSAVLGLALQQGLLAGEDAYAAGQLEEAYQIEKWGDDPIALAAREDRQVAFAAAVRFLASVNGRDAC